MFLRLTKAELSTLSSVRVTPDPERAAELERRMNRVEYRPENGFHRDCRQHRRQRFVLRALTARG